MRYLTFILLSFCILFLPTSVNAHRPYLVKQGLLIDPEGKTVIKEKLYGDGIVTTDPVVFQIRSSNGAVLASTTVSDHVGVFCPSVQFCWAFPYGIGSVFSIGQRLDFEKVDWEKSPLVVKFEGDEKEDFLNYLTKKDHKNARSNNFDYPEYNHKDFGFNSVFISSIFSPFIIIFDQFFLMVFLTTLTISIPLCFYYFFIKARTKKLKIFMNILGSIVVLSLFGFYLAAGFIFSFALGAPIFYLFIFMIFGAFIGSRLFKKFKTRNLSKVNG